MKFYTYLYLDPKDNTPRYVGKGKEDRAYSHLNLRKRTKLRNMLKKRIKEGYNPQPIITYHKNEKTALAMEIFWIAVYGREDLGLGTLFNLTDGGEGTTGRKVSKDERHRKSISQSRAMRSKPRPSPKKGIPMSQEQKDKIKASKAKNPTVWTEDSKEKLKGRIPWNKGSSMPQETKDKISQSKKGKHYEMPIDNSNI